MKNNRTFFPWKNFHWQYINRVRNCIHDLVSCSWVVLENSVQVPHANSYWTMCSINPKFVTSKLQVYKQRSFDRRSKFVPVHIVSFDFRCWIVCHQVHNNLLLSLLLSVMTGNPINFDISIIVREWYRKANSSCYKEYNFCFE